MIAVDTNVLVRILIDDPGQADQVEAARALASRAGKVYSHLFGKNPRLQAGETSVLAHVKIPACSNIGPP